MGTDPLTTLDPAFPEGAAVTSLSPVTICFFVVAGRRAPNPSLRLSTARLRRAGPHHIWTQISEEPGQAPG